MNVLANIYEKRKKLKDAEAEIRIADKVAGRAATRLREAQRDYDEAVAALDKALRDGEE